MKENQVFRVIFLPSMGVTGRLNYIVVPHTGSRHDDCLYARKLLGLEEEISIEDFKSLAKTKRVIFY